MPVPLPEFGQKIFYHQDTKALNAKGKEFFLLEGFPFVSFVDHVVLPPDYRLRSAAKSLRRAGWLTTAYFSKPWGGCRAGWGGSLAGWGGCCAGWGGSLAGWGEGRSVCQVSGGKFRGRK